MNDYRIKLEVFEGPLDLLLWLVQNNNMDIYDIEISGITSQYLGYLREHAYELDSPAEFLSMASRLIRIKSSLLLPKESPEYIEAVEEKKDLTDKLLEWKKIKESREILLEKFRQRKHFFRRENPAAVELDKKTALSVFDLADTFARLIKNNSYKFETIMGPEIYLEDVINDISQRIKSGGEFSLFRLVSANPTKLYISVLLLALLDLTLKKTITLHQNSAFSDIRIVPSVKTPAKAVSATQGAISGNS